MYLSNNRKQPSVSCVLAHQSLKSVGKHFKLFEVIIHFKKRGCVLRSWLHWTSHAGLAVATRDRRTRCHAHVQSGHCATVWCSLVNLAVAAKPCSFEKLEYLLLVWNCTKEWKENRTEEGGQWEKTGARSDNSFRKRKLERINIRKSLPRQVLHLSGLFGIKASFERRLPFNGYIGRSLWPSSRHHVWHV